jgi:hypothetical protein
MRILKLFAPAGIAIFGLILAVPHGNAKMEYSKKEKKGCTFCHTKAGSKELNDAGKYYKEHNHSLEGYKAPAKG